LLSRGDPTVFFTRPLSLGMLIAGGLLLTIIVLPAVRKTREEGVPRRGRRRR
jgi:TctA family transporter